MKTESKAMLTSVAVTITFEQPQEIKDFLEGYNGDSMFMFEDEVCTQIAEQLDQYISKGPLGPIKLTSGGQA